MLLSNQNQIYIRYYELPSKWMDNFVYKKKIDWKFAFK